jgi:N utilization substance protein B
VKTFQRIVAGKRYQDYMEDSNLSFEDDQKFIGKLFLDILQKTKISTID